MKEVKEDKSLKNERFSYGVINEGNQGDVVTGYASGVSEDDFFIELRSGQEVQNPFKWKMHISLIEDEENIGKAWNVIVDTLIRYKVPLAKVLRKGSRFQEYQKGKEITIYFHEGDINWAALFDDIENTLLDKRIVPNYKAIGDKQVEGSQFLSCRQGEYLLGIQSDTHNPSGIEHIFESLNINPRFPKVAKIVRQNEERVKLFYNHLEKNYFEILDEFRVNFPYLIGKRSIFSRIKNESVEYNLQKYPAEVSTHIKEIIFIGKEIEMIRRQEENLIEKMNEQTYQAYLENMLVKLQRIRELVPHVLDIIKENSESDPSSGGVVIKEATESDARHAPGKGSPRFVIEYSSVEGSAVPSEDSSRAEESPQTSEEVVEDVQQKSPGLRK